MPDLDNSVRLQMNEVDVKPSSARQTPITSFGEVFKSGMATGARAVGNTAAAAGYAIPGASVVGAAISGVGTVRDSSTSGLTSATVTTGGIAGAGTTVAGGSIGSSGGYMDNVASRAAGGDASSQMMMATQQMTEMNQTFNLQYLQLQEKMQSENREFTALSNVMKTKSDTAKNSLSNLK